MAGLYILLIVFPLIFFSTLIFIFQSGLESVNVQQLRINCPYPINAGIAILTDIDDNNNVVYSVTWDNSTSDYHQTYIKCGEGDTVNAYTTVYTTANNWFNIGTGYLFYFSNILTSIGDKLQASVLLIYSYINAPAEVSGLSFFTYIQGLLLGLVGFGVYAGIRGIGN